MKHKKRVRTIPCQQPCTVCGRDAEYHHVWSYKAGGSTVAKNLMPLCREHHREVHDKGLTTSAKKYVSIKLWLIENEWEFNDFLKRWINPQLRQQRDT